MKIIVVEVEMNAWKTTYTVNLNSDAGLIWEDGRKEYEITDHILETIEDQEVLGWIEGNNRYGKPVKRTYMIVPNQEKSYESFKLL